MNLAAPSKRLRVILALWSALAVGTLLRAATPQDFGYGSRTLNGTPVSGHVPLLVVTFELSTNGNPARLRQPIEPNINGIVDSLVFNLLVFPCVNGFLLENSHGSFYWERAAVIGPVTLTAAETITLDGQSSADSGDGIQRTGMDSGAGIGYLLGLVAAKTGYNFAQWDGNNDGSVTQEELSIMLFGNNGETSGANRPIGAKGGGLAIPGQNVTLRGRVASLDHHTSFMTMTHELSHSLGTVDLYNTGCWNSGITLMSCTIYPGNDDRRTFDLDPWHKIQFGWVVPRIFTLGGGGVATVAVPQYSSPNTPVILYDPARGTSEYFIIEFRNNRISGGAGYDANLTDNSNQTPFSNAASGMAIWHVSACPPGQTSACPPVFHEGATWFIAGGNTLWNQSTPLLKWSDGGVTATRLNPLSVSPDGRDLQFEWLTAFDTWVDFSYLGGPFLPERGTFDAPFNTLTEGVVAVSRGGIIKIKGGSTSEKLTIAKPLTIEAFGAPVTLGR